MNGYAGFFGGLDGREREPMMEDNKKKLKNP